MYKSIADVFNSPEAIFNDPFGKVYDTVQSCKAPPEYEEYDEFLDNLTHINYPKPVNRLFHNIINPKHGSLKPMQINCK